MQSPRYEWGYHGSDERFAHVAVATGDGPHTLEGYSLGLVEDVFDVALYHTADTDDELQHDRDLKESRQAMENLCDLANLGLKTVALVGYLLKERERVELDWKAYYLSKAGTLRDEDDRRLDYDQISQLPAATIREAFVEDDWQHYDHDHELEDAVGQGEGWDNAVHGVLRILGVEK